MWCLARLVPLMLGNDVPLSDKHRECFLLMLTIIDYVFAPVTSIEIIPYLQQLIKEHHEMFKEVYPTSPIIPKMHYMIHLPEWIMKLVIHVKCTH